MRHEQISVYKQVLVVALRIRFRRAHGCLALNKATAIEEIVTTRAESKRESARSVLKEAKRDNNKRNKKEQQC